MDKLLKDLKQQIAHLEAKLAELREQITILNEENSKTFMKSVNAWQENAKLKQQLVEKEKEVEQLNNRILISQLQVSEEQRLKIIGSSCYQYNPNQDKISFCIEQLVKVKEDIKNVHIEDTQYDSYCFQETTRDKCVKIIDNQIAELKEK